MKFPLNHSLPAPRVKARAFSLVEMMVAVTVFFLLIVATVSVQIYATRVYTLAAAKLKVTGQARVTMNDIRDQVRGARQVYVGSYASTPGNSPTNFAPATDGTPQQGNALMIYPTLANNSFTLVYLQALTNNGSVTVSGAPIPNGTNALVLLTYTNGAMEMSNNVADFVTNQIVFDAENFLGTELTNSENNYLIHMTLDFSQFAYSIASMGSNQFNAYDYYQLNTVITRRDTD
jgi:Tfp pilus assembly protein PilW